MPMQTCTTAQTQCSFGLAPSVFMATPRPIMTSHFMAGNIMDNKPIVNIVPFGMCSSPANPTVAAATAAALGVLTPMPCLPATSAPWLPGAVTVILDNAPALDNTCKLLCNWGGVISFITPGQFTHLIP